MAKFEIEMELTGLKLRIRGEREDIPRITSNLGHQLAGMFQPTANIVEGTQARPMLEAPAQPANSDNADGTGNGRGRGGRRRRSGANGTPAEASKALLWNHNPGKWGNPRQAWTAWQKILWLLYVADQETGTKEMSGPLIALTFNTHFRQAGLLRKQSMPRDLGTLKQRSPALVSDHAEKSPITWFLTEEGVKEAEKLVAEAKGGPAASPAGD